MATIVFLGKTWQCGKWCIYVWKYMVYTSVFLIKFLSFHCGKWVDMECRLQHKLLLQTPNNLHISPQGCLWFAANDGDGSKHHQCHLCHLTPTWDTWWLLTLFHFWMPVPILLGHNHPVLHIAQHGTPTHFFHGELLSAGINAVPL
jgi:hypothetical protein